MDIDPDTNLARAGQNGHNTSEPAVPPLNRSFQLPISARSGLSADRSRSDSPSRDALEEILADLDGGAGAVACSTGMAAVSTITNLFDAQAHVVCSRRCNAQTKRLFSHLVERGILTVSYHNLSDPSTLDETIPREANALWVQTPSDPLLSVTNLEALSSVAADDDLLLVVDNTILSPLLQRPIEHGADLVVYSSLASLPGTADVRGGAVISRSQEWAEKLDIVAETHGTAAVPVDSWLGLRDLRSLPVRTQQRETNARSIAYALHEHPAVKTVFYPGLRSHPAHEVARRQQDGYGGTLSFVVEPRVDVAALINCTQIWTLSETLGGVRSRIEHPASMSNASLTQEQRESLGLFEKLVRLSVGIESTDDLLQDLEQALEAAGRPAPMSTRDEHDAVPGRVDA